MLFVIGALLGGWLVGTVLGGSLSRLERLDLRQLPLIGAAVVLQVLGTLSLHGAPYVTTLIVSLLLAGAFVLRNPHLPGRVLIVGGLALNAAVIAVNGAMPVSAKAASQAGVSLGSIQHDPRHVLIEDHTHLSWLADRIPLALPWQPQVLSVGDIFVAAGVGLLVAAGMLRGARTFPPITIRQAPPELRQLLDENSEVTSGHPRA